MWMRGGEGWAWWVSERGGGTKGRDGMTEEIKKKREGEMGGLKGRIQRDVRVRDSEDMR